MGEELQFILGKLKSWMPHIVENLFISFIFIIFIWSLYRISDMLVFQHLQKMLYRNKKVTIRKLFVNQVQPQTHIVDEEPLSQKAFIRHLQLLLKSTSKRYHSRSVSNFIFITLILFGMTYLNMARLLGYFDLSQYSGLNLFMHFVDPILIAFSGLIGALPYIVRKIKLQMIRTQNSYDLVPALEKFQLKYRNNNYNFYYTMMETTKELHGDIKTAFGFIVDALQTNNKDLIKDGVDLFVYQIHTSWTIQIGIMFIRASEGRKIDKSLSRINRDMTEHKNYAEEEKSNNSETIFLGYFPLLFLPIILYFNQKMSDGKAFTYYFTHPLGTKVFIITLFVCFLCLIISHTFKKPKFEI